MVLFYWLILIMPLERHPLWGYLLGPLTVIKWLGLLCVFYAVAHLALRKNFPPLFKTWQARFFILLYVMITFSYILKGQHAEFELSPFLTYTAFVLLFFVTVTVVDSAKRLRWVLLAALGSLALSSLYLLREYQKGGFEPGVLRGWVFGDSNNYAISPLACLPVAFYLLKERLPRWERLFCLGCLVLGLTGLIFSGSRGALIGITAASFYIIWHGAHRLRNLTLVLILAVPLLALAPASPVRRLFRPNFSDQASTANHIAILKAGLRMVAAHPIVGVGFGNFKGVVLQYADPSLNRAFIAHNVYLEVAAEMGLPALLIYALMLASTFRTLGRLRGVAGGEEEPRIRAAASGMYAGLLGASVGLLFVSGQNTKLYWLMLFLSMCMPSLAESIDSRTVASRFPPGWRRQSLQRGPFSPDSKPVHPHAPIAKAGGVHVGSR